MASQMRFSLEDDMKEFLEARTDHNATTYALTEAAVRMGINTLFNITAERGGTGTFPSDIQANVNLRHNVKAIIFHGDVISQAEAVLRAEKRETANLFLLVMFFDEYLKLVTDSQKTYEEAFSCTLLGAKLFPRQYGASEAALFYDQTAASELREIFESAKLTAAGHLVAKGQAIEVDLNILEPKTFRTEQVAGTRLYPSHARNILEGLKATMTSMLKRVAEGKYSGETRIHVEAQFGGTFDYDSRVSSVLAATQHLQPPFYCLNRTESKLSMGLNHTALIVDCDGGRFKPFLNHGLAATSAVEAVLSSIMDNSLHNATEIEERAACYKKQLNIDEDIKVDAKRLARNAMGLSLSFAMLRTPNMALWRDLQLNGENRTALQLFFYRHSLRHCGKEGGVLTGEHMCHLALLNMPRFFEAYGCRDNAPMRQHLQCDI